MAPAGGLRAAAPPARGVIVRRAAAPGRCSAQLRPDRSRVEENRDVESDARYRRVDNSAANAHAARLAFAREVSKGEARVDLAAAALWVAAEDDALVTHSAVALPVDAFQRRLARLAEELGARLAPLRAAAAPPADQVAAALRFLFDEQRFRAPGWATGRATALPEAQSVEHPGVWENARHGYLTDALTSRVASPAVLALLLNDVWRRTLAAGAADFAVRVEPAGMVAAPSAEPLPGLGRAAAAGLNSCTSDALAESLRLLKRAYWPWAWHPRRGGFAAAAAAWLDGDPDAEVAAIARTAAHRLARGIWTSPGAGDARRAATAAERLVLLAEGAGGGPVAAAAERRDLAALYLHAGRLAEARAELLEFNAACLGGGAAAGGLRLEIGASGLVVAAPAAGGGDLEDARLVERLLQALARLPPPAAGEPGARPLTLARALAAPPPPADDGARLPLTW